MNCMNVQTEELRRKSNDSLTEARADTEKLRRENANLWQYFDKISDQEGFKNYGKTFSEVKERQQRRKIREVKTYVELALWFAETFGLKVSSVRFKDSGGVSHTIDYQTSDRRKNSYKDLSEEEKEKIKQVLYVTDKFCIGEAAYHSLTMTDGGEKLPCSYLVKQSKNDLNNLCHITRTPGEEEGVQLDLESELQNTIKEQASFFLLFTCQFQHCSSLGLTHRNNRLRMRAPISYQSKNCRQKWRIYKGKINSPQDLLL